jgi:hypothetical protein
MAHRHQRASRLRARSTVVTPSIMVEHGDRHQHTGAAFVKTRQPGMETLPCSG